MVWEPLTGVLERVNAWQAAKSVRVINVETLVLPVANREPVKPGEGGMMARWDEDQTWVQVVRVWHEPVAVTPPVLPADQVNQTTAEALPTPDSTVDGVTGTVA